MALVADPRVSREASAHLAAFLAHRFPVVRSHASEQLLLVVQSLQVNRGAEELVQLEEILLTTAWYVAVLTSRSAGSAAELAGAADAVRRLVRGACAID